MSNQTVIDINLARQKFNDKHPLKARRLLLPASAYQRRKIEEYAYVARAVARLYSNKGLPFDDLHSACLEAVVKCAIKMDTEPYAYTLVYRYCRDCCVDLLRAFYRTRPRLVPLDVDDTFDIEDPEEPAACLLDELLSDAPADYRELILDHIHLESREIRAKYHLTPKAHRLMTADLRAWVGNYLFG